MRADMARAADSVGSMARVVTRAGRVPGWRALLALGAALMLVGHLLGPHSGGHAIASEATAGRAPAWLWHGADESVEHPERSEHHDPASDPPCGYLCLRGDDHGTAGALTGWCDEAVPLPAPPAPAAPRRRHACRAPPDPVRELQVMRV
ncbi:hypothetical protein FHU38_002857 [Saccharomonospora amisosensis]|uniref:Uncharacterized protein n=1 Tax=Saccharomonospora amisosensis TaxID=1128677 RepID=A0A7X5UQS8_9PSEU|nr:hypothetical protein [Saccharomonospora amisosensis]NIJ12513.1 hypothetical protein [Saccharomonospora amisosensis]